MDHAQDRRIFVISLLLSAGLHLALGGLGVMTGWGRMFTPPAVLEVTLVAPRPAAGDAAGARANPGGALVAAGSASPARKKPPARPRPLPEAVKPTPPAPAPVMALAAPPGPAGPAPGAAGREQGRGSGFAGAGAGAGAGQVALGSGGPGGGGGGPAQGQYLSLVRSRILARRHYPPMARERQQQGVVRVRFALAANGALSQGVEVVRPSGFRLLDDQARQCVLAASPFPPFPRELHRDHLTIEVPIVYKLTERE